MALNSSQRLTPLNNTDPTEEAAKNKWSITGDLISTSDHHDCNDINDNLCLAYEQKIKDIREVMHSIEDPSQRLMFVDATQRLGIDYHFQQEIETFLEAQYMEIKLRNHVYHKLSEISLCFRLLRQQGYNVGTEIFNDFMDKEGTFSDELKEDLKGLMELYEAAQLNLSEGDLILHEAAKFSTKHLNESLEHLDENQASKVRNTLKHPYHKILPIFMAKRFFKDFEGVFEWIKPFQELAQMEFEMSRQLRQHELSQISKWWNNLKVSMDLKLARDQPLKWYTWTMATLTDIGLSELRIELTKVVSFIYLVDDIYDIYGTLDQLILFTEAIKSWESAEIDELPDYMKMCFKALCNLTNEIGCKIFTKYGHNPVYFLRKTWESFCDASLVEAEWFASKQLPKTDEYLGIARESSGVHLWLIHTFFLLGFGTPKESAICLQDIKSLTSSIATIFRLYNDLGSAKDGNEDGTDGSYIDCYVQEHSVTVELAKQRVLNMISNEWVRLNNENHCLCKHAQSFLKASLNLARMIPLMYDYDGDKCLPLLEAHIKFIFQDI